MSWRNMIFTFDIDLSDVAYICAYELNCYQVSSLNDLLLLELAGQLIVILTQPFFNDIAL